MIQLKTYAFWLLALGLPLTHLPAQMGGGDPSKEIKEIAEAIDKQLKKIDELLLESGRKGQSRSKPKELLQQAAEGSEIVQDGIDKLIEKLNDMKNKGGSGSGSGESEQQQQGQPQDGQQQPKPGQQGQSGQQRRENQTPDFVQQPQDGEQKDGEQQGPDGKPQGQQQQPGQNQPGKQPQQQPGQGQPKGGKDTMGPGQNRQGNAPPNGATGKGQPGTGQGGWGNLQPYLNFLRNRGASPKVPAKYRKYYEAYLKNKQKGK